MWQHILLSTSNHFRVLLLKRYTRFLRLLAGPFINLLKAHLREKDRFERIARLKRRRGAGSLLDPMMIAPPVHDPALQERVINPPGTEHSKTRFVFSRFKKIHGKEQDSLCDDRHGAVLLFKPF